MKKVITYFIIINFMISGFVYAQDGIKLIENLGSSDWNARFQAARTIQRKEVKAKECIEPLLVALSNECQTVTESEEISHRLKQTYRLTLVSVLEDDKKAAIDLLHKRKEDNNSSFRNEIIILLGQLGDKAVFDSLMDMLASSKDGYARSDAAMALGFIGDNRAIPVLEKVSLEDEFIITSHDVIIPLVRESAKCALKQLGASPDKWKTRSVTNER